MGTVVLFKIPPRQEEHRHRRIPFLLTFMPEIKEWRWSFMLTPVSRVSGVCTSYLEAMQKAKATIDLSLGA